MDTDWLTLLCAAALAFSVMNYVLLDGTDLGVGILLGLTHSSRNRRAMAVTILPIWDANETWLVLGGGGLLALFPLAYAILLPALYVPFIAMFLALILRAMALEFRDHAPSERVKRLIDGVLLCGSLCTGLIQGIVLGTLVKGVPHLAVSTVAMAASGSNPFRYFAASYSCWAILGWALAGCIGEPLMNCSTVLRVRRSSWLGARQGFCWF